MRALAESRARVEMAAADATTAMTINFLRARLLSERSVSRAAKDRADQLATRVAELEEQLRTVTAQRRKAERVNEEVLAILDSQGFGRRLSDAADSGSDDEDTGGTPETPDRGSGSDARGEAEDALSGSELGGPSPAGAPQPGGLSWKGRAASPDSDRRQPHHEARQLRQRHGHSHRRSGYIRLLPADSSPKYQPGQSCRKIKRMELRLQTEDEDGKDNVAEDPEEEEPERSDCTACTDEQHDLDGEVSQDGPVSSGDGRVQDGNERYTMECEKDGEMERVLEKQAELIGQYQAQENAQREWEKKFNGSRDSTSDDIDWEDKLNQNEKAFKPRGKPDQIMTKEVVREEAQSKGKNIFGIRGSSECLLNSSASVLSTNAPEARAMGKCKESDNVFGRATAVLASVDSELHVRKDELVHRSYNTEIIQESGCSYLGRSASLPQKSYNSIPNTGHNKGQGDGNSDSGSGYHENARSYEHYITTPSVGSPLSDTPKSKMSEWSSSCFHNHTDNQIDMQQHQLSSDGVGGVLDALQRAKMALRDKLSRASPPRQDMLALPAPEDHYVEDDLLVNDTELSLCMSVSQEMLSLPASGDYISRISLPGDDAKVPIAPSGLFRLPTDSFPQNEACSNDGYGSKFTLTSSQQTIFSRNPASHMMSTSSHSQYGSGFSANPYYDPHSSMLSSMSTKGDASFIPEILMSSDDSRRGMRSRDAGMLTQYGTAYN
uniref:Uncharacterized protein n=1 Tax=Avena sativa TaxID=4498 RepID=A0ACD5TFN0_AVESA